MKLSMNIISNLRIPAAKNTLDKAAKLAMRDTVVAIHNDSIRNAKAVDFWDTGHNARSLAGEVSGMGTVKQGKDAEPDRIVNDSKLEGAVYSTSGYGGYGETGYHTRSGSHVQGRPYMNPALVKHTKGDSFAGKVRKHL